MLLVFDIRFNTDIIASSRFGEPPQLAVWLENPGLNRIRTVWVTRCMGKGLWKGKVESLTSLPYWSSRYRLEIRNSLAPSYRFPVPDAITGATPADGLQCRVNVPADSEWDIFAEVNLAGDFNLHFPAVNSKGIPNFESDGQPALVYHGKIQAEPNQQIHPEITGVSNFQNSDTVLSSDQAGITSAVEIIQSFTVFCTTIP